MFDDEFDGTALDPARWAVLNQPMQGTFQDNQSSPANVSVANGALTLSATPSGTTPPYDVGWVETTFGWSTGYFEARAQMPTAANGAADGYWPAIWGNGFYPGGPDSDPPELDLMQWTGTLPSKFLAAIFPTPDTTNGFGFGDGLVALPGSPDLGAAFHVYGVWWTGTQVTWYVDGVEVQQVTTGQVDGLGTTVVVPSNPVNIILQNAVQEPNLGNNVVDAKTVFPGRFVVDYVHLYQNTAGAVAVTPDLGYGGPGAN